MAKKSDKTKEMRVVYLAGYGSNFPSRDANSIHIMRMCEAIAKLGHEVFLIVSSRKKSEDEIFEHYGIEKSFRLKIVRVPFIKGKTIIYSVKAGLTAKSMKPHVLLGRNSISCASSALMGMRILYDSHGPVWEQNIIKFMAYKILRRSKNLKKMTVNSYALKKMYEHKNLDPPCGITVAHNGSIEFPFDELPKKWPGRANTLQIGYMGHLYPKRELEIIVKLAKNLPQFDFHVVGGNLEDISFWQNKSQSTNLYFHGFVKHSVIHRYRNKCDILLAPYGKKNVTMAGGGGDQSNYMNPIKVIEYMASKKPIICSDIPILKELLDEDSAIFATPSEISDWISAIYKLQKNLELKNTLANNAYHKFKDRLTWESRAKILLNGM